MPAIESAGDAATAAAAILKATAEGELTPLEATAIMGLVDSYRRTLEVTELEARMRELEKENAS